MKNIQFRTEDEIESQVKIILKSMGLDLPTFLRMCLIAVINKKSLPFHPEATVDENGFSKEEQKELDQRISDANTQMNLVEYDSAEDFIDNLQSRI